MEAAVMRGSLPRALLCLGLAGIACLKLRVVGGSVPSDAGATDLVIEDVPHVVQDGEWTDSTYPGADSQSGDVHHVVDGLLPHDAGSSGLSDPDSTPPVEVGPAGPYRLGWKVVTGADTFAHAFYGDDLYLAGGFFKGTDFGGTTLTPVPRADGERPWDAYVAKYSTSAGALVWVEAYGGSLLEMVDDIAVTSDGDVIVLGRFTSSEISIDGRTIKTLLGEGSTTNFIARLSPSGAVRWVHSLRGQGTGVAFDSRQNLLVGGSLVVRYDSAGQHLGVIPAVGEILSSHLVVDGASNLLVCGHFSNTLEFHSMKLGSRVLRAQGKKDVFVAKISPDDAPVWAVSLGGVDHDHCVDLHLDDSGNPLLGVFGEGKTALVNVDGTTGVQRWTRRIDARTNGFALAENGDVISVHTSFEPVDLGGGAVRALGVIGRFSGNSGAHIATYPMDLPTVAISRKSSNEFIVQAAEGALQFILQ